MLKKITFIALVPNTETLETKYTLYFLEREKNILLPIQITKEEATDLFRISREDLNYQPTVYDTFKRVLISSKIPLISITVYKYVNSIYYTYLNLVNGTNHMEINAKFSDALNLAKRFNVEVYIDSKILNEQGIKITKRLLKEALE